MSGAGTASGAAATASGTNGGSDGKRPETDLTTSGSDVCLDFKCTKTLSAPALVEAMRKATERASQDEEEGEEGGDR